MEEALSLDKWILALLAYAGGKIEGATRLQKGLFMVKMEVPNSVPAEFEPSDYGPFSREIANEIGRLKEAGLIDEEKGAMGDEAQARVFKLTEEGWREAKEALEDLKKREDWNDIKRYFDMAVKDPLMRLLVIVYNWYPEYSKVSKIRRKVDFWKRMLIKRELWEDT